MLPNPFETELSAQDCLMLQGFINLSLEKSDILDAHYNRQSIRPEVRARIKEIAAKLEKKRIELLTLQN